jgi:hypothetical protein
MGPLSNFSTASMTSFFTAVSMAAATVWREGLAQPVPATRMEVLLEVLAFPAILEVVDLNGRP